MSSSHARTSRPIVEGTESAQKYPSGTRKRAVGANLEGVLTAVLLPLAAEARRAGVEIVCEILPTVGEEVRGDVDELVGWVSESTRRTIEDLSAAATAKGESREVWVRIARQFAGLRPSPTLCATVQGCGVTKPVEVYEIDVELVRIPTPDAPHPRGRVLVATPSDRLARLHRAALARWSKDSVVALDHTSAIDQWRTASRDDEPFRIVVVDDALPKLPELLGKLRSDPALAVVLETAGEQTPGSTLAKPMMPFALARVLSGGRG